MLLSANSKKDERSIFVLFPKMYFKKLKAPHHFLGGAIAMQPFPDGITI